MWIDYENQRTLDDNSVIHPVYTFDMQKLPEIIDALQGVRTKVQFETNHRELFDKKVDEEDLNYIYTQAIAQDDVVMDGQIEK